jgi:uncharacterized membrane protein YphA (DoxX/SURF4 family)
MIITLSAVIATAISLCAFSLFIFAGTQKLRPANRDYYRQVIEGYQLPVSLALTPIVVGLAICEIAIALLIILPGTQTLGLIAAAVFVSGYALAMANALHQGARDVDCGCNGPGASTTISYQQVLRNSILALGFALAAAFSAAFAESFSAHLGAAATVLATACGLVLILIYLAWQQLASNHEQLLALKKIRKL